LTDPNSIPINNTVDPHPLPPAASSSRIFEAAVAQLKSISASPIFSGDTCGRCQAILEVAKFVSLSTPSNGPAFFIEFCSTFKLSNTCNVTYGQSSGIGSVLTQVVANADVAGYDGQVCTHKIIPEQITELTYMDDLGFVSEFLQHVPGSSNVTVGFDWLVHQTQT